MEYVNKMRSTRPHLSYISLWVRFVWKLQKQQANNDFVLFCQKQSQYFFGVLHVACKWGQMFHNQVINMKYGTTSKLWKHPACNLLSVAPAYRLAWILMCVLHGRMWWRAEAWQDVCPWTGLAGESSKFTHPSEITKCKEGNWLDSTCNRDCKTSLPKGPRQSSSHREWRGFGSLKMSLGSAL